MSRRPHSPSPPSVPVEPRDYQPYPAGQTGRLARSLTEPAKGFTNAITSGLNNYTYLNALSPQAQGGTFNMTQTQQGAQPQQYYETSLPAGGNGIVWS